MTYTSALEPRSEGVAGSAAERTPRWLFFSIAFLIVSILTVVLYGVLAGLVNPPAPRTQPEAVAARMGATIAEQPGNGQAWADYAEALYASGDKTRAFEVLGRARKSVKDESLNAVNAAEVHILLLEGRDKDVVARTKEYIQKALDLRTKKYEENAAKGVIVPFAEMDNRALVNLFMFRGTAQTNLEDYDAANEDFTNALAVHPQAADIQVMRGWVRLRSGDKDGARSDFEAALQFLPDDPSALKGIEALGDEAGTEP